jgi:excisionase family DNA binding protein
MSHLLKTKEAAEFLGVSEQFLERARWAGKPAIPFVQVGERAVRYDPDALKEYLKSRVRYSTTSAPAHAHAA